MKLSEIGYVRPAPYTSMPAPGSQPKPPAGAQTAQAVQPVQPAANVSVGGTNINITDPEKFKRDMAQQIKTNPEAGKRFAELLTTLLKRK